MRLPLFALSVVIAAVCSAQSHSDPAFDSGRYATDAYPGFDDFEENTTPQRKTPRWFSFFTGPECDSSSEQMKYCKELLAEESWSDAVDELDALVRAWPSSPEAPQAQLMLAETLERKEASYEKAFKEYRYLVDFYSLQVDYNAAADSMYRVACTLKIEGKKLVFFRFDNNVDVRRAFEACVLRAPGAKWVPSAMLMIAKLREDEGQYIEAIKVYENLRNIRFGEAEAQTALVREAAARMKVLSKFGYNRDRIRDTLSFLESAQRSASQESRVRISSYLSEVRALLEEEDYLAAKFYDSRMRTGRSAISAYEDFLMKYPDGVHSEEVKARLEQLKKGNVK